MSLLRLRKIKKNNYKDWPGLQLRQSPTSPAPVVSRYVPLGQGSGVAVPLGQKCPAGHTSP